ncbi:MFS general substrate transporter [Nadsonia fulvescens var. elongata DSM 6958]|uniref:MFS general substrate transporter n=1 Tax=Nadsonia fulvescens var. elongata DSM 6958 TaxID=857566 RepID=A0A1E3PQN0_9ASCO|nr:MFS general substrate transporter [Nadsonia fulvescens var. elongata DSM 6958]
MPAYGRGGSGNFFKSPTLSPQSSGLEPVPSSPAPIQTFTSPNQTYRTGRGGYGNQVPVSKVPTMTPNEYLDEVYKATEVEPSRYTVGRGGAGNFVSKDKPKSPPVGHSTDLEPSKSNPAPMSPCLLPQNAATSPSFQPQDLGLAPVISHDGFWKQKKNSLVRVISPSGAPTEGDLGPIRSNGNDSDKADLWHKLKRTLNEEGIERETLIHGDGNKSKHAGNDSVVSELVVVDSSDEEEESHVEETNFLNPKTQSANSDDHSEDSEDEEERHETLIRKYSFLNWKHRPSTLVLAFASMILALAFGILIAPKINLIINLICQHYYDKNEIIDPISGERITIVIESLMNSNNTENKSLCMIAPVQALTSQFQLYAQLINGILCTLTVARLGSLSDRIGRKPVILWVGMCSFLAELVIVLCARFPSVFKYQWVLVSSFLDGLGGSMTLLMALNNAYATDCTSHHDRARVFGTFHASLFFGLGFGPMLGSLLVKYTGSLIFVIYCGLALYLLYIALVYFLVIESRTDYQRRKSVTVHNTSLRKRKHRLSTISENFNRHRVTNRGLQFSWSYYWYIIRHDINIFKPLKILIFMHLPWRSRINAWTLVLVDGLFNGIAIGMGMVLILYAELQFGWGSVEAGYFVSVIGFSRVFTVGIVLPGYLKMLNNFFYTRSDSVDSVDLVIIRCSLVIETIGLFSYAMATSSKQFVLACLGMSMSAIVSPVVQSCLVKHVSKSNAGTLLGALGLFHSLMKIIAPMIFLAIYSKTVGVQSNMVFLIAAGVFGMMFLVSMVSLDKNATVKLEPVDSEYNAGEVGETVVGEGSNGSDYGAMDRRFE